MPTWPTIDHAPDELIDHIESPFHNGICPGSPIRARFRNPRCGDEVEIQLRLDAGKVQAAWFLGQGCAISQAAASMLCERVEGLSMKQAFSITPEDSLEMLGCPISPLRQRCALLAYEAFLAILSRQPA
jgi:nitrogen fixation NifU-like protein